MPDDAPQLPTAAPRGLRHHWPLLGSGHPPAHPLLDVSFSRDDEALIVDNQLIKVLDEPAPGRGHPRRLTRDLWSTTRLPTLKSGYYRPLMLLSLGLDRSLAGLSSAVAHFHALLWHLLAVGMAMASRTACWGGWRGLAATLFALHPVQSEVLALVAARNDSMAAALVLGALWLLVERAPSAARIVGAAALALLALLSKESAVLALFMLFALDLARFRRPVGWPRYAALAGALVAYVPLRRIADLDAAIAPTESSLRLVSSQALQIAGSYAQILVWPWPLTPARHVHYLPEIGDTLQGLVLLGAALALAVWKGRDRPWCWWGWPGPPPPSRPPSPRPSTRASSGSATCTSPWRAWGSPWRPPCLASPPGRRPWWRSPPSSPCRPASPTGRTPARSGSTPTTSRPPPSRRAGGLVLPPGPGLPPRQPLFIQALEGDPPYRDVCEMVVMSHLEAKEAAEAVRVGKWALTERAAPQTACSSTTTPSRWAAWAASPRRPRSPATTPRPAAPASWWSAPTGRSRATCRRSTPRRPAWRRTTPPTSTGWPRCSAWAAPRSPSGSWPSSRGPRRCGRRPRGAGPHPLHPPGRRAARRVGARRGHRLRSDRHG